MLVLLTFFAALVTYRLVVVVVAREERVVGIHFVVQLHNASTNLSSLLRFFCIKLMQLFIFSA